MRVLSGIQPTGRFHWGNYFGAIRQYIDLQTAGEAYYFIANLHALTTVRDKEKLQSLTYDSALDLLALGLDPERASLFVQSDVPEISELSWILMTGTPMGLLERCHAYKEKRARGLHADLGLFAYPVLMAADILGYDSNIVPVGQDQVQHIEVARDIAKSFNHQFGECFVLPEAKLLDGSAKVPGSNGEKMSKSYDNTIEIFGTEKAIKKKIMRIVTDSRPMEEPKDPEEDHLFQLYSLFASPQQREELASIYRGGGFAYGHVKMRIAEASADYFRDAWNRREALEKDPDYVRGVLRAGAEKARTKSREVLERARTATGLSS